MIQRFRHQCLSRIETMGSIPIPGTNFAPTTNFVEYLREVKRLAPTTIFDKVRVIKRLQKRVNLWDVSAVERYLLDSKLSNGHKNSVSYAYQDWCKMNGFDYTPKLFKREEKLPYVPRENEIDQLISGCGFRLASFLQLLKESGCRPREAWMLKQTDFDIPQQVCYINSPAKGSNPRVFKMSSKLTSMISRMMKINSEKIWDVKLENIQRSYQRSRHVIATRLSDPNLLKISMRTLRHWKATTEYARTKDILHVKRLLGHKRIENTLVYTHLLNFQEEDAFTVRIASTIEEFTTLLESGFEFVADYEGRKILRKRK
jgi:integrase